MNQSEDQEIWEQNDGMKNQVIWWDKKKDWLDLESQKTVRSQTRGLTTKKVQVWTWN